MALSPEGMAVLTRHDWPGNVRELRNALVRAAILARGRVVRAEHLVGDDHAAVPAHPTHTPTGNPLDLRAAVAETERRVIRQALDQAGGNRTRAATLLGISRRQLFDKVRAHGLDG